MDPLEIQYELKKRKKTQKQLAEELGVSEMTVSAVINKQRVSNRVMRAVSAAIDRDHIDVFPEYYYGPKLRSTSKVVNA